MNKQEFNIHQYIEIITSRWYIIFFSISLFVGGAFYYTKTTPRIYQSTGTIAILPKNLNLTRERVDFTMFRNMQNYLQTQYDLIVSTPLLQKTFDHFNFAEKEKFRDVPDPLRIFRDLFTVTPLRKSFIVRVSFKWTDPRLPPRVVDFLQKAYIQSDRERRVGLSGTGIDILYRKEGELRTELEAFADQIQNYVLENKLINVESRQSIILQRLNDINQKLTEVELQRIAAYTSYRETVDNYKKNQVISTPEVLKSRTIQELKVQSLIVDQEIQSLIAGRNLGINHPQVVALKSKKKVIEERLSAEVIGIMQSLRDQYHRYKKEEDRLKKLASEQQNEALSFSQKVQQYYLLKKKYDALETSYQSVKERLGQLELDKDSQGEEENIYIASPPLIPKIPIWPKTLYILVAAFLFSSCLGFGLCFMLEFLDNSIKGKEQVEKVMERPVLGLIAEGKKNKKNQYPEVLALSVRSPVAESFRSLRTTLSFSIEKHSAFFITSPVPGDGKSFCAANIAVVFTQNNAKVLLIDADMRKSRQHQIWNTPRYPGLSNLIADSEIKLDDVVQNVAVENLSFLPAGVSPPNPIELVEKDRFAEIIATCKQKYDYVIIDCPPIAVVADGISISKVCQAGLLVVKNFKTPTKAVNIARDVLKSNQVKLSGVILNNMEVPKGRYYNSGYYNYGYYGNDGLKND